MIFKTRKEMVFLKENVGALAWKSQVFFKYWQNHEASNPFKKFKCSFHKKKKKKKKQILKIHSTHECTPFNGYQTLKFSTLFA